MIGKSDCNVKSLLSRPNESNMGYGIDFVLFYPYVKNMFHRP